MVSDGAHALVKHDGESGLVEFAGRDEGKAISGACVAFLNMVFDFSDLFGSSICRSPMPVVINVLSSAVVIFCSIGL